jgi:YD repeat-containing protein
VIRRAIITISALAAVGAMTAPLAAQREPVGRPAGHTAIDSIRGTPNYDVVLEVPRLSLDSLVLRVDSLDARLSARARVANLVSLDAGVAVSVDSVGLTIAGVGAQVFLYVDLDNVARVVNRVVQTLDRNPAIVTSLLGVVDSTVQTVGGVANNALRPGGVVSQTVGVAGQTLNNLTQPGGVLTQTVNAAGQTVQLTLDNAGNLVSRTLSATGQRLGQQTLGALTGLPVLRQTTNAAGQTVKQVRAPGGQLLEFVTSQAGQILGARLLQGAARP